MASSFEFDELWTGRDFGIQAGRGRKLQDAWVCHISYATTEEAVSSPATRLQVVNAFSAFTGVYIGTSHRDWSGAKCVGAKATCDADSPSDWTITVDFEEPVPPPTSQPGGVGGSNPEPQNRSPKVSIDYRFEPYSDGKDLDGLAYVNSAGDWLENAPPKFKTIMIIKWTRYYTTWSDSIGAAVAGKVNSATWHGKAAKTCRIVGSPARVENEKSWIFWSVDWTVEYDKTGWNPTKVIDIGRNYFNDDGKKVPYQSVTTGRPMNGLTLLDGDGGLLPDGGTPFELEFRNFDEISFDFLDT